MLKNFISLKIIMLFCGAFSFFQSLLCGPPSPLEVRSNIAWTGATFTVFGKTSGHYYSYTEVELTTLWKLQHIHLPKLYVYWGIHALRNEGPVRIQYKCRVPIYAYSQKWNIAASLFPKQNNNVLSPNSYTHISVGDLYISRISLPILLQGNMWTDPGNI